MNFPNIKIPARRSHSFRPMAPIPAPQVLKKYRQHLPVTILRHALRVSFIFTLILGLKTPSAGANECHDFLRTKASKTDLQSWESTHILDDSLQNMIVLEVTDLDALYDLPLLQSRSKLAFEAAQAVQGSLQDKTSLFLDMMNVPSLMRRDLIDPSTGIYQFAGPASIRLSEALFGFPSTLPVALTGNESSFEIFEQLFMNNEFVRNNFTAIGNLKRNLEWDNRLKKRDPELAKIHREVDEFLLHFRRMDSSSVKLRAALTLSNGGKIKTNTPSDIRALAPEIPKEISFGHFYLQHVFPHTSGFVHANTVRSLETRMEKAETRAEREEIFAQMMAVPQLRKDRITSFSVFEDDVLLAPNHLLKGRNFKRITQGGSKTEMIRFTSSIRVAKGFSAKFQEYDQDYIIAICGDPNGCKSQGQIYQMGEVVTFFPDCGPFILRFPSLKRLRQKYIEDLPVTDFYLTRRICD